MDDEQKRRAGAAVEREMEAQGLTLQDLSEASGVAVVTIRDLIRGRRWPWASKRYAIELALGWPGGRIAEIAKGNHPAESALRFGPPDAPGASPVPTDMRDWVRAFAQDYGVQPVLEELMQHGPLSAARRARLVATYLELLEEQQQAGGGGVRRRTRGPRVNGSADPDEDEPQRLRG